LAVQVTGPGTASAQEPSREYYTLPGLDHGLIQSPVNILSGDTAAGSHSVIFAGEGISATEIRNTGHSVQLQMPPGASVAFDGDLYELKQCHFHTPSEHQIDGVTYPMEMHCVSTHPDTNSDGAPEYLVVAFLYKMGQASSAIGRFIDAIPPDEGAQITDKHSTFFISDIVAEGDVSLGYFTYQGSLTTPPYTETVRWLVKRSIREASPQQIRKINQIEGNNARHVQALFGRIVESN
jgi:carbonic anhydrase